MPIEKIYLHWTAGSYTLVPRDLSGNAYHAVVKGSGELVRVAGYHQRLNHTYNRNTDSVGIACACMGVLAFLRCLPPEFKWKTCAEKLLTWQLNLDGKHQISRIFLTSRA